jgi:hypothetical protein
MTRLFGGEWTSDAAPNFFLKPHQYDFSAMEQDKGHEETTVASLDIAPIELHQRPSETTTDVLFRTRQSQPQDPSQKKKKTFASRYQSSDSRTDSGTFRILGSR